MNLFVRFFTVRGRAAASLKQAIDHSKTDPSAAIREYTSVIDSKKTPGDVRAMALFNRGLAYSQDHQADFAANDFKAVLVMSDAPRNVLSAARERVERLRRRAGSHPDAR